MFLYIWKDEILGSYSSYNCTDIIEVFRIGLFRNQRTGYTMEQRVPMKMGDFSVLDSEFNSIKDRFGQGYIFSNSISSSYIKSMIRCNKSSILIMPVASWSYLVHFLLKSYLVRSVTLASCYWVAWSWPSKMIAMNRFRKISETTSMKLMK